jgi:Niemann-Pick C1 protein
LVKDAVRDDPIIARVQETMEEVANSISMTTITTIVAFALGAISSIPAVRWLCIYGLTCIGVDFIYQNSYFIAWMVLDERRVQTRRKDICFWIVMPDDDDEEEKAEEKEHDAQRHDHEPKNAASTESNATPIRLTGYEKSAQERFMGWYADKLLHPASKAFVLVLFAAYTAGCIYSTALLTQQFNVENYVPKDSHVQTFFVNFEQYSSLFRAIQVYFRNEDQSDPVIQQQMIAYTEELAQMDQIGAPPMFFWLRDFADMANNPEFEEQALALGLQKNATFEEQIDSALSIPEVRDVYGEDIVRDPDTGVIISSRCYLYLRKIDMESIPNQISLLLDQRKITQNQPINTGKKEASFFTFDDLYFFFELYAVTVQELIVTTISGVVSVIAVTFVLVPHWSAIVFVTPLIIALYFMLLGKLSSRDLFRRCLCG